MYSKLHLIMPAIIALEYLNYYKTVTVTVTDHDDDDDDDDVDDYVEKDSHMDQMNDQFAWEKNKRLIVVN